MSKILHEQIRVAIVHDELVRRGGAEVVLEELVRLYPQADVYALYAGGRERMTVDGRAYPIHTSSLQRWPKWFRQHPKRFLWMLPQAAEQFDFSEYDLVLSSASGFAKGIITRANVPHICYCHTPTRYLWDSSFQVLEEAPLGQRLGGRLLQHQLRLIDATAAQRPDAYIANSHYTKRRIERYYRRDSAVVYPPIDTAFFTPAHVAVPPARRPFLVVGRLTAAKRIDQAIQVCEKLHLPLHIVGVGRDYTRLRALAGRHTTFLGKLSDEDLRTAYRGARALLQPGVEDFGMAAAQAQSCGVPIIAYGEGGVLEIVRNRTLGLLYQEQRSEALAETIRRFLLIEKDFQPGTLQKEAFRFRKGHFRTNIQNMVEKSLEKRHHREDEVSVTV